MTKQDLKKLIAEVYEEEMSETKKKQTTKVAPKVVKKVEEPVGRITKSFVQGIEDREKSNKMRGDKTDAAAFDRIGKILRKHVGRTLEEGDIEQMMEEMSCEESVERPYVCVHTKKGKCEVKANSSYEAVKKAAQKWGLKSTTGIDAHLKDTTHTAVDESVCEECYEEGAKPDFLDLDKDGNKAEPMKKAASDAKNKKHHDKLKEIIQKAKNI